MLLILKKLNTFSPANNRFIWPESHPPKLYSSFPPSLPRTGSLILPSWERGEVYKCPPHRWPLPEPTYSLREQGHSVRKWTTTWQILPAQIDTPGTIISWHAALSQHTVTTSSILRTFGQFPLLIILKHDECEIIPDIKCPDTTSLVQSMCALFYFYSFWHASENLLLSIIYEYTNFFLT